MPTNPNMRNDKLRGFFEELGFTNVKTVIASGNVIFESTEEKTQKLEKKIEEELPKRLGFSSTTLIRSQEQLEQMVKKDPFNGTPHSRESYQTVTFLKDGEIFNSWNMTVDKGPEFMKELEKKHGKNISTRTWNTILKIVKIMST